MKTKILNVLRKSDGYVSGQALCNMLGVSRTAVWKVINQLKEEGYVIEAVQNKGYHITQYPDILTSSEIMSQLTCVDTGSTTGIIREVVYYDETDSTNNEAKRAAERDNAADGTLYITESQTGGRGRRGRNWVSPAGSGIWMSLLLRPDIAPVNASMLTIVAAMAVQEAIHKVLTEDGHDAECRIKWPNDIVLNKKKVCGILTEMSAEMDYIHYVVIGMGINVNTTEFDDSIKATASSLYLETGDHLKRSRIVAAFSESFAKYYDTFVKTQNLAGLKEDYNSMLVNKGGDVKAIYADKEIVGKALGINDEGELIIKTDEGDMDMFDENVVLCVSNSYEKKYYFNPDFDKLPDDVKNELKIMCVLFTEEVGGILDMEFDEEGNLLFKSSADEGDLLYDEIACGMLVKKYQYEKRELLESLEMFFKVFFLGME